MAQDLPLSREATLRLIAAGDGDAALLYLAMQAGQESPLPAARRSAAEAQLARLGLLSPQPQSPEPARPSDAALQRLLESSDAFRLLSGEVQWQLGRILSFEELRILAGISTSLGMDLDVVGLLVHELIQSAAQAGRNPPTLRAIEKAAYRWADQGIRTMEQAAAELAKQKELARLLESLARRMELGRSFKAPEAARIRAWTELGFGEAEITFAYERCLEATHDIKWPYMDKIVRSWHEQGLHELAQIKEKDQRPAASSKTVRGPLVQNVPGEMEARMVARLQGED